MLHPAHGGSAAIWSPWLWHRIWELKPFSLLVPPMPDPYGLPPSCLCCPFCPQTPHNTAAFSLYWYKSLQPKLYQKTRKPGFTTGGSKWPQKGHKLRGAIKKGSEEIPFQESSNSSGNFRIKAPRGSQAQLGPAKDRGAPCDCPQWGRWAWGRTPWCSCGPGGEGTAGAGHIQDVGREGSSSQGTETRAAITPVPGPLPPPRWQLSLGQPEAAKSVKAQLNYL